METESVLTVYTGALATLPTDAGESALSRCGGEGITSGKFWDCVCKVLNLVHFWPEKRLAMPSIMRS